MEQVGTPKQDIDDQAHLLDQTPDVSPGTPASPSPLFPTWYLAPEIARLNETE